MPRILRLIPRSVAIAIAVVVALGVLTLVILTAIGAFAGTSRTAPFHSGLPAPSTTRPHSRVLDHPDSVRLASFDYRAPPRRRS